MTTEQVIELIKQYSITEERVRRIIAENSAAVETVPVVSHSEEFDPNTITMPATEVDPQGKSRRYVRVALRMFQDFLQGTKDEWLAQMDAHPPYVGTDNYWRVWNPTTGVYERSTVYAKGDDLHWEEMSETEKNDLADRVAERLVFATVEEGQRAIAEL